MKLPGWQASISTAMPRKSPALQGSPAMVRPAVQRFVPLEDPNDYMRLARAEAGKYEAIGGAISKAVDVGVKIIEEDETARANSAIAQYSEEMAKWTTATVSDPSLYQEVENADGTKTKVYQWEDAEARFEAKAAEVQARLTDENEFKTSRAKLGLQKGFTINDEQFRTKVQKFVSDRRIDRGRMADVETLNRYEMTGNILGIEALREDMIQGGRWNASQAYSLTDAAIKTASYTQTVQQIQMLDDPAKVSALMDEVQSGKGWGKKMSVQQRQQVLNEGQRKLTGIYLGELRGKHNSGGLPIAYKELNRLADGGPEVTGAIDEVHHEKMIGTLRTALERQSKIDDELYQGQEGVSMMSRFGAPDIGQEDVDSLAVDLGPGQTKNRKQVDQAVVPLAKSDAKTFYNSPEVKVVLRNGALVGYTPKPIAARISNDIRNGSLAAVDTVRQVEAFMPGAVNLEGNARDKLEFMDAQRALGLYNRGDDPVEMHKQYAAIENRDAATKARDIKTAEVNLEEHGIEKSFTKAAEQLGFTDNDYFSPDVVAPGSASQIHWEDTYKHILPFVGYNHERAARRATEATMTVFGATTAYGNEPVTEYKAPEAIQPAPGFRPGQPNEYYDQQLNEHLAEYNERTGSEYTPDTVKRAWVKQDNDGVDYWTYVDLNGQPLAINDAGGVKIWPYKRQPEEQTAVMKERSITKQSNLHISDAEQIAATSGVNIQAFDDVQTDPNTGRISPSTPAATAINSTRWSNLSDEEKDFHNTLYMSTFVEMVRASAENPAMAGIPPHQQQLKIHLFLNSRGYMRGKVSGEFLPPPGGY